MFEDETLPEPTDSNIFASGVTTSWWHRSAHVVVVAVFIVAVIIGARQNTKKEVEFS